MTAPNETPESRDTAGVETWTLRLEAPVAEVVVYALARTIDDLEARAIVAEHHDPALGPASAAEYRTDVVRLRTVLSQLSAPDRTPDPEQAAVVWLDHATYTVANARPVPLISHAELQALIETTLHLVDQHLLTAHDALTALSFLIDLEHPELLPRPHTTTEPTPIPTTPIPTPTTPIPTPTTPTPTPTPTPTTPTTAHLPTDPTPTPTDPSPSPTQTPHIPTPHPAHRLAPGCRPPSDEPGKAGGSTC